MQLLEDVFIIENLQVINEGRGPGPMKISGCFQRADEENNNKRIYKKAISDYRLARNRAVERARKAEQENEKLKLKLKKYANI